MIDLPWGSDDDDTRAEPTRNTERAAHEDAVVVCRFQDGTLAVYEDRVVIERVARSKFDDRTIPFDDICGVDYAKGLTIGYIQLEVVGVTPDAGGLLSDPVNERTLHFGRGDRACAAQARDAILERANG